MSLQKIGKFVNERLSLFVGVGIIISIHWGWYRLQQVPHLVNQTERSNELPIIKAVRFFNAKITDSVGSTAEGNLTEEPLQKVK